MTAVGALTLAGAALRVASLDTRGLWLDEAITVKQSGQALPEVVRTLAGGVHPPLYHILMHLWMTAFGSSEIALRSFSVVLGVVAIPFAFWAASRLYDRRTGLIAAGLIALSPFQVWYAQEARMYELLFVTGLMSVAFFALALRERRTGLWVAYFVSTLLGLFTHYFFLFLLVGEVGFFLLGVVLPSQREAKAAGMRPAARWDPRGLLARVPPLGPWLACMATMAVLLAAWAANSVFVQQSGGPNALLNSVAGGGLGYGQEGAKLALRFNDSAQVVVQMVAGFHSLGVMDILTSTWPLLVYLALLLMHVLGKGRIETRVLLAGAAGVLALLLLGQWQGQILASRYFMAVAGPLTLLAARVLARLDRRIAAPVLVGLMALALVAWADQSYDPLNAMRYDNREAFSAISSSWQPGDTVIYVPFYVDPLVTYYVPSRIETQGFPQSGAFGGVRDSQGQIDQDLDRVVGPSRRVWLFLAFQNIPLVQQDALAVRFWLKHQGFRVAVDRRMNQVHLLRYDGQAREPFFSPAAGLEASSTAATSSVQTPGVAP